MDDKITISCDDCCMEDTSTCDDCVISFMLQRDEGAPRHGASSGAIVIDAAEARAVRMLAGAGLVPELRHSRAG